MKTPDPTLSRNATILAVFSAISHVLAIRLFLLLAVIGAFVLAFMAMSNTDAHSIWVLVAYCSLTVLPLVFLDIIRTKKE